MKNLSLKSTVIHVPIILSIALGLFLCAAGPAGSEPSGANFKDEEYTAKVTDISGAKYYPAVKKAIEEAGESVYMAMYVITLNPRDNASVVYDLVNELIKARRRGVKVTVTLDRSTGSADGGKAKNEWSFKVLKEAGADTRYDDPHIYMHAKGIVIDREVVILGSANWSYSALTKNFETNVLIRSKELAAEFIKDFENIKTGDEEKDVSLGQKYVPVSWRFLENPGLAGRMMTSHDERAMDIYLLCLREFDGNGQGKITIDYEKMAVLLGLGGKMTREEYRRQITRSLKKLDETYRLIKFEPNYAKDADVILLDYNDPAKVYKRPNEWYFRVPGDYWKYGWASRLSMRAKLCYLINLAYVGISNDAPWWFSSRDVLAKRFNVKQWLISQGMGELRRLNLIDVLYDGGEDGSFDSRSAKSYKVLPLYDPAWLEGQWDRLKLLYGLENLEKSREYAKVVYKENDPDVVEEIIKMTNAFGEEKVQKAFAIVAEKHPDNPKRCYAYVKGILNKWGGKEKAR